MNRHLRFKLAVLATIVVLAAASAVTWRSVAAPPAGDEHALVDEYARVLHLERWYEWRPDEAGRQGEST
jgi:hypothetical protein